MDPKRFQLLKETLLKHSATRVNPWNGDFTKFQPTAAVTYCVLDPSCSGSGMRQKNSMDGLSVGSGDHGFTPPKSEASRVENLAKFQLKLLTHALGLPCMQRVVYSTCSIWLKENEEVVKSALAANPKWKLVDAHETEKVRGWADFGVSDDGELNRKVLRLSGLKHGTQGFFVACFQRQSDSDD